MFYEIRAYNSQTIIAWSSSPAKVEAYADYLSRGRDVNHYFVEPVAETEWASLEGRDDVLNMDEPYWDADLPEGWNRVGLEIYE